MSIAPSLISLDDYPSPNNPDRAAFNSQAYQYTVKLAQFSDDANALSDWINENINGQEAVTISTATANILADYSGNYIRATYAGAKTLTIQPESSIPQLTGAVFFISNKAVGDLTISAGAGVTINNNVSLAQNAAAIIQRIAADTYDFIPIGGEFLTDLSDLEAAVAAAEGDISAIESDIAGINAELLARVQTANSISDLIAITGMVDKQQVSVASFWPGAGAMPRGGGIFEYSASTPKSLHNGITVISPTVPTISAQAGVSNSHKAANWINGVGETTPAGTGCWLRIYTGEWVASWAGAYLDGTTNSQPQLQAWLDKAYNTSPLPSLYFEDGFYNIEGQGLKWDSAQNPANRYRIKLRGANRNSTILLNAGAPYAGALFDFGGDALANLKYESSLSDIQFVGDNCDYALKANFAAYISLNNVSCSGAAAIGGFKNDCTFGSTFVHSLFKSALDGYVSLTNGSESFNNSTSFVGCTLWQNGRFGANVGGSFKTLSFIGGTIFEQNAGGGLIAGPGEGLDTSGAYFENNATTGHTFTSPAFTVKANIILGTGGSYLTTITDTADNSSARINGCETQGTVDCFVFAPGCTHLEMKNNEHRSSQAAIPLVMTYGNTVESPGDCSARSNWSIADNKNYVEEVKFLNNTVPMRAPTATRSISIKSKNAGNYTPPFFENWFTGSAGVASVWSRSGRVFPDNANEVVWNLSTAGAGTSDYKVFTADAAFMSKYHGKLMIFGAWIYTPFTNDGAARMIVQNVLTQSFNDAAPGWAWKGYIFTCDNAATARFGIAKSGVAGAVDICKPYLGELGAFRSDNQTNIRRDFYGSAAPTTGTWLLGDRVWKVTPTSGTTPGWICTVAGTPGTWVAMANLA